MKLIKYFIIFAGIHLFLSVGTLGYLTFNTLHPALEETEISLFEFISDDLSEDQYVMLQNQINKNAAELGKTTGKKIVSVLDTFFPDGNANYSDLPPMDYPYPSADEVINKNHAIGEKALKDALNHMDENEDSIREAQQQGLDALNNLDATSSKVIKETLSTMD
jgi:hypothetical protein